MSKEVEQELFSFKEAEKILGIKESTLRAWKNRNKLEIVKVNGSLVRIPLREIERLKRGE